MQQMTLEPSPRKTWNVTLESAWWRIAENPTWAWVTTWVRLGETCLVVPEKTWATKDPNSLCPREVQVLGCSGLNLRGKFDWVGWDLDVGHGDTSYASTHVAIQAGKRIRAYMGDRTEIRLSKGGRGVHVRHLLDNPVEDAAVIAKEVSAKLGIRADRSSLGRQVHYLWCRKPLVDSFRLIEAANV